MKIIKLSLISLLFALNSSGQSVENSSFADLQQRIDSSHGTLVVNYWATWCKPCVAELPYFEAANEKHKDQNVKVILVNLDFNSKTETLVKPFVLKNNLKSKVIHITDTDPNLWINKVDSTWSGAIPATLIYKEGKKVFFTEGEMSKETLEDAINSAVR